MLLHQSELKYLDESLEKLQVELSTNNIQAIVIQLNR